MKIWVVEKGTWTIVISLDLIGEMRESRLVSTALGVSHLITSYEDDMQVNVSTDSGLHMFVADQADAFWDVYDRIMEYMRK